MSGSSPVKSTRRPPAEGNGPSVSSPAKTQSWMQTAMTLTGEALRQATWIGGAPSSDAISPLPMAKEQAAAAAAASGSCEQLPTPHNAVPANAGKEDPPAAAAEKKAAVNPMVGRKILKPLAGDKLCDGFVAEHKPAGGGREEMWVLRWELESEQDEEVTKAVLDKRINLKAVQEREFPPADAEDGKPGTRKDRAAKAAASPSKAGAPPKASAATKASKAAVAKASSATKASAKSTKASKAAPKRRASAGRPLGGKSKKAKTAKASTDAGADELRANKKDVGKFVAKQFEQGIFTGRVVKVRKGSSPLWQIRYEDEDVEELNKEEATSCLALYQTLKTKFSEADGSPVSQEQEEAADGGGEEGGAADASKKGKEKGKGKVKRTPIRGGDPESQIAVLGLRVRKSFGKLDEEYDGTVSELYPKEKDGDDDLGDLWLVKYDDGDSEHMDLGEVQAGAALYDKRHALQKKEITFSGDPSLGGTKKTATGTKIVLYAEMPAESRLFATIEGYRADKKAAAS